METTYFKVFGQKSSNNKIILVAVVDDDFLGEEVPEQFELQGIKTPQTIYTGTYPTLRLNTSQIKDVHEQFRGSGISGVLTENDWYCVKRKDQDIFGISI